MTNPFLCWIAPIAAATFAVSVSAAAPLRADSSSCPYTYFHVKNASLVLPTRLHRDADLFNGRIRSSTIERAFRYFDLLQSNVALNDRSRFELLTHDWRGQRVCSDASSDWGRDGFPAPSALLVGRRHLLVLDQHTADGGVQLFFDNSGRPIFRTLLCCREGETFILGVAGRPVVLTTGEVQIYRPLEVISLGADKISSYHAKSARLDAPASVAGEFIALDLTSLFGSAGKGTHDEAARAMLEYFSIRNDTKNVRILQETLAQTRGIISERLRQQLVLRTRTSY
jgi:hypothetical protein